MSRPVPPTSTTRDRTRRGRRLGVLLALVWALALVVNRALRRVEGPSMLPSLWPGDLLLTVPATWVRPRPGDVVVAEVEGRRVTKRLVAPPGSRVELRDGHLLVDGDWWAVPDAVLVEEDAVWDAGPAAVLLGDHRARSTDTRTAGAVDPDAVDRVALARLAPCSWLRGRATRTEGARRRPGVRLVVLDPDDRVLLFRVTDVDGGDATWWEAPGGGRRPGEAAADAARRELAEEVGAVGRSLVPLGDVHVRHTTLAGAALEKVEDLFAVRLADPTVDPTGWTTNEHRDIAEVRWWTRAELASSPSLDVVPGNMAALAERARRLV